MKTLVLSELIYFSSSSSSSSLHPLFPGANEVDQIAKIHDVMGTPDDVVMNKFRK